jgi:predicted GTPase
VVVIDKLDSAEPHDVQRVLEDVRDANPTADVVFAKSPVSLDPGAVVLGRRVLVVEDGPTLTCGGMAFGAGFVAARDAGAARIVDPRPYAVGSIADTFEARPQLGDVIPAMGYSEAHLRDLERTIDAADCDVVVTGTPVDLSRLIRTRHPIRRARSELEVVGEPSLERLLEPILASVGEPVAPARAPSFTTVGRRARRGSVGSPVPPERARRVAEHGRNGRRGTRRGGQASSAWRRSAR